MTRFDIRFPLETIFCAQFKRVEIAFFGFVSSSKEKLTNFVIMQSAFRQLSLFYYDYTFVLSLHSLYPSFSAVCGCPWGVGVGRARTPPHTPPRGSSHVTSEKLVTKIAKTPPLDLQTRYSMSKVHVRFWPSGRPMDPTHLGQTLKKNFYNIGF